MPEIEFSSRFEPMRGAHGCYVIEAEAAGYQLTRHIGLLDSNSSSLILSILTAMNLAMLQLVTSSRFEEYFYRGYFAQ